MLTKTVAGVAAVAALVVTGLLIAQPGGGPGGMGPPGGPMGPWLDELEQAYQAKDMDKVGDLIDQMKQQRRQFQTRRSDRGFAGPPPGMPGGMRGMRGPGGGQNIQDSEPLGNTDFEKKALAVLADLQRNDSRGMMNVPLTDGRCLRLLVEAIGAKHIAEIGTSNGYSGIWQCLALKTTGGRLTTFEIDAARAALARENFQKAGVNDMVTLVEGDAHERVGELTGPLDMVFIDADKEGYLDYLKQLLPKVRPGGLIVAHNINAQQADPQFVQAITTSPELETVFYTQGGGMSVTLKKRSLP